MQDRNEKVAGDLRGELRMLVALEMSRFLESVVEVDLATVYRTIVAPIGVHAAPYIAEVIAAGLRVGTSRLKPGFRVRAGR